MLRVLLAAVVAAGVPNVKAPATYTVDFKTTKGPFDVTVHRAWAPRGADRFYNLVRSHYFDGDRLFRVIPGFVVQFGINPKPAVSKRWVNANIKDDRVKHSNTPGTVSFAATSAPNSRSAQVFVNLGSNANLDSMGFAPFGIVTKGMANIRKLYAGYGENPTNAQQQMIEQGDPFIAANFPKLDRIVTARIVKR